MRIDATEELYDVNIQLSRAIQTVEMEVVTGNHH